MNNSIIGLGSNIAPELNIKRALYILRQKYKVIGKSTFLKTSPIGITNQKPFINGAVLIKTPVSQRILKDQLKILETLMGRKRFGPKFGPRNIDLDIITWNNQVVDKDYNTRAFLRNSVEEIRSKYKL